MTTSSTEEKSTENKSAEKVRDVVAEWIETVAAQGEKALQALGLGATGKPTGPLADVVETASHIIVTMDLPAVDPQHVDVVLAGNMLTVKGERQGTVTAKGHIVHRRERPMGEFQRSIPLPVAVDPVQVSAECRNGVLVVTLAKEARTVARQIKVEVASEPV